MGEAKFAYNLTEHTNAMPATERFPGSPNA